MKALRHLLDKIAFAAGVIIFLQLPHFIDQYTQRLGGYHAAQKLQLDIHKRNAAWIAIEATTQTISR